MNVSSEINMFSKQSSSSNGIPFTPRRENSANLLARAEAESRTGASFDSVAELMADLNEAD